MIQYINKDDLVKEIKRKIKNINLNYVSAGSHPSDFDVNKRLQDGISKNLQSLLSFIDTLDVKEIYLEKEYKKFVEDDPVYSKLVNSIVGKAIAKHFFDLGVCTSNHITEAD